MVWSFLGCAKELMLNWKSGARGRRHKAWDVTPLALTWVIWKERNKRAFEGVKISFPQLRNSLWSLIVFWSICAIPVCMELGAFWREPYLIGFSSSWYITCIHQVDLFISNETSYLIQKKKKNFVIIWWTTANRICWCEVRKFGSSLLDLFMADDKCIIQWTSVMDGDLYPAQA